MACIYNPVEATESIKIPRQWCNVIWGYCQFQTDESVIGCPILAEHNTWYKYWLFAQPDTSKKITLLLNNEKKVLTIGELRNLIKIPSNSLTRFVLTGASGEIDIPELLRLAMEKGYVTIYDEDNLISLGLNAFARQEDLEELDISNVLYIGEYAFFNCKNLKNLTFKDKKDIYIPVLDNINAFFNEDNNIINVNIYVPDSLYDEWIKAPNWVVLKDQIKKLSEYGD